MCGSVVVGIAARADLSVVWHVLAICLTRCGVSHVGWVGINVGTNDVGAFLGKKQGDATTDARARARAMPAISNKVLG